MTREIIMKRVALGLCGLSMMSPAFGQIAPTDSIRISSNFSITQSVKEDDTAAIDAAQEAGRKTVYERAGQECKLLLETLASKCRLDSLNVFANVQNRGFRAETGNVDVNTTGNAQFWVTPKN
jgi:hypothetical protein